MRSTMRVCSGCTTSPSPGTSGTPLLRVSPYAMNENFVTAAEAASDASGVAGGSMGFTATHTGGEPGARAAGRWPRQTPQSARRTLAGDAVFMRGC